MTALIGWLNYVTSGTLSAGSEATNMGVSNLQLDQGSADSAWQTEATVVTAADGATVTVTPSSGAQTWRVFGVFRTNLTTSATVTFKLYNSPSTLVWSGAADPVAAGYGQAIVIADTDQTADYLVIEIDDATNPDGFINVPLAFAGPAWAPVGPTWAATFGRVRTIDEQMSRGGQEFPVFRHQRRFWDIPMDFIGDSMSSIAGSELYSSAMELERIANMTGNVLFIPAPTAPTVNLASVFGRFEMTTPFGHVPSVGLLNTWRFRITERL